MIEALQVLLIGGGILLLIRSRRVIMHHNRLEIEAIEEMRSLIEAYQSRVDTSAVELERRLEILENRVEGLLRQKG